MPRTVSHRFDKHPLSLLYFGYQDEYYCEICEGEVNPFCWFYHCDDGNWSLHKECIHPVSFLPQRFITHESHQHTLPLKETCMFLVKHVSMIVMGLGLDVILATSYYTLDEHPCRRQLNTDITNTLSF
ncbi:unnamed protein product [Camellia sinensis]